MSKTNPWNWAFAVTEADLGRFKLPTLEIPVPDIVEYKPFVDSVTVGDGGQRRYGYAQIRLTWETITDVAYRKVSAFIRVAEAGTDVMYATLDLNDDSHSGDHFVDLSGYPHYMTDMPQIAGSVVGRRGIKIFRNFTLFLNNVTIVNDPSNYAEF